MSVIYISHRLEEVFKIADVVSVLKDGQLVDTKPIKELDRSQLVRMMVGRSLEEIFPVSTHQPEDIIFEAKNISTDTILNQASLYLRKGEIVGLAGMVGSGRTELARALFGADMLVSGSIYLKGKQIFLKNPSDAIKKKVSLVPEDRKQQGLFIELPIRNNISMSILRNISMWGFLNWKKEKEIVELARKKHSIAMVSGNQEIQYLSGGNQQKVVLAKWLQTRPEVIIMDEPTRGIDVGAKFEIYQLMRQLNKAGIAILMISSELIEILGMSDRILVMKEGSIVAELQSSETSEEQIIEYATTK